MKPLIHAKLSVTKYGGEIDDYLPMHEWMDQTKAHVPDMRHRAILHSSFGIYLLADRFGDYFCNSDERLISTRDIGEEHVIQDLDFIPTIQDYLDGRDGEDPMPMRNWYGGLPRNARRIALAD